MKLTKTIGLIMTILTLLFTTIGCAAPGIQNSDVSSTTEEVPAVVEEQLAASKKNIDKYLKGKLEIVSIKTVGELSGSRSALSAHEMVSDEKSVIAYGNIMQPETVNIGEMGTLYSNEALTEVSSSVRSTAEKGIKAGTKVLEITWKSGDKTFKTNCYYDDSGIVWDNVLSGLVMVDPNPQSVEETEETRGRRSKSTYRKWIAQWLWGSKRGEVGYKITIYYYGKTVSSTSVVDWGYITYGNARSYSRVTKNSGRYGRAQYALGLSSPTVSLSFSRSSFTVSAKGIGSRLVANGSKVLYP